MDSCLKLIRALFLVLIATGSATALAFDPESCPNGTEIYYGTSEWGRLVFDSAQAACEDYAARMDEKYSHDVTVESLDGPNDYENYLQWICMVGEEYPPGSGSFRNETYIEIQESCSSCEDGMSWDNETQRCMADIEECPISGDKRRLFMPETEASATFCDGQRTWHKTEQEPVGIGLGDGPIWRGYYYEAREHCEASDAPAGYPGQPFEDTDGDGEPDAPPDDRNCGITFGLKVCNRSSQDEGGSSCGEVNGQTICPDKVDDNECVPVGDAVACAPGASSPPAPDNGTPGEPAQPDAQVSGSDADGNPTAPVSVYNNNTVSGSSGGTQVSEGTDATPGDTYNGGDDDGNGDCTGTDCGDDGNGDGNYSGGTSCETAPICEGSAETCGVVHQEWLARCEAQEALEQPGESDLLAETGLDGYTDLDVLPNEERNVLDIFDDSGFLGARSCPDDMQVDYYLGEVTIPISKLCGLFQLIGMLVLIGAYLIAARIVAGGF